MKINKKIISNLTKCYSIAPLHYKGKDFFLVAAEKTDRCILFDLEGNEVDTIWEQPGGVMSMVQVPGSDGVFLATHRFYSPNDSKEASIVLVRPPKEKEKQWSVETLVSLPHVHRFDIIERNGIHYLIACTLKSGHEYKDDWSSPGKVYGAVLPENLGETGEEHALELFVIKDQMLKNHGYYRVRENGNFECIYSYEKTAEFCHAIYGGSLCGENALVIGHRKGNRDLLCFSYDKEKQTYQSDVIDHDCGPANVWHFVRDGKDVIVSTNRETDEVAMYEIER